MLKFAAFLIAEAAPRIRLRSISPRNYYVPTDKDFTPLDHCTKKFFTQPITRPVKDVSGRTHFDQKYYECQAPGVAWKAGDPIFFYTGNENDVELYVNLTGLMWERAHEVNAKLIFAEHRYFGESYPFSKDGRFNPQDGVDPEKMKYCTTDEALADFAALSQDLRKSSQDLTKSAVIGFGGSYGGMLCAWLRMKYPDSIDGCISGSAPVLDFEGLNPPFPEDSFAALQTFDATPAAGAADGCNGTIQEGWDAIRSSDSVSLQHHFSLCSIPANEEVVNFVDEVLGFFSMGSYPFPSNYMTWGGQAMLPPYPMRVGCEILQRKSDDSLLQRLGKFSALYYNASLDQPCFNVTGDTGLGWMVLWNVLTCTSMVMPAGRNGIHDMFWKQPWNLDDFIDDCKSNYGLTPDTYYVVRNFGQNTSQWAEKYSNILFTNGEYDPWITGGVKDIPGGESQDLLVRVLPANGHHADLMFAQKEDTKETIELRDFEMKLIKRWIARSKRWIAREEGLIV